MISDSELFSIAYDCNAMPEDCTDESLRIFGNTMYQMGMQRATAIFKERLSHHFTKEEKDIINEGTNYGW